LFLKKSSFQKRFLKMASKATGQVTVQQDVFSMSGGALGLYLTGFLMPLRKRALSAQGRARKQGGKE